MDFILVTEVFHCLPSELDAQDDRTIQTYIGFIDLRNRQQHLENKRAAQRAKMKKR